MPDIKNSLPIQKIFLFCILAIATVNCLFALKDLSLAAARQSQRNIKYPGYEFGDLKQKLPAVRKAGFLTDKDMSPERNDGQFLAAQFIFAPIMLELNNPHHEFIILDYTSLQAALDAMKKDNIHTVYINGHGKILGRKKL